MILPRKLTAILLSIFVFALLPLQAFAANLTLTHIGALNLQGQMYNEWWYTGTNPLLRGTADANTTITISVNDTEGSATADASGNWSFQTTAPQGDHNIKIAAGGETIEFVLHAGQAFRGTSTTTNGTNGVPGANEDAPVPVTGVGSTLTNMLFASSLIGAGILIHRKRSIIVQKIRNI